MGDRREGSISAVRPARYIDHKRDHPISPPAPYRSCSGGIEGWRLFAGVQSRIRIRPARQLPPHFLNSNSCRRDGSNVQPRRDKCPDPRSSPPGFRQDRLTGRGRSSPLAPPTSLSPAVARYSLFSIELLQPVLPIRAKLVRVSPRLSRFHSSPRARPLGAFGPRWSLRIATPHPVTDQTPRLTSIASGPEANGPRSAGRRWAWPGPKHRPKQYQQALA